MILSDFILDIRARLNDNDSANGYRFSKPELADYLDKAIKNIRRDRPDSRRDANGNPVDYDGLWEYTESGSNTYKISGYGNIEGWDKDSVAKLYFGCTATGLIKIYPSSSDRTADTNELAWINFSTAGERRRVIEKNSSAFGGSVEIIDAPSSGDTWEVDVIEAEIPLDNIFYLPAMHYAVYLAFEDDNEDTYNANRAGYHRNEYNIQMGIA